MQARNKYHIIPYYFFILFVKCIIDINDYLNATTSPNLILIIFRFI